jgi:hypothetical protein
VPTPPLPISATLVPGILRTRGVEVSSKRLLAALGGTKGGAAAVQQAKARRRLSNAQLAANS